MLKKKQLKKGVLEPCTRSFTQLLGLLCVHTIDQKILANKRLTINDLRQHWHYYKLGTTWNDSPEAR